jgi:hypothetical protein
MFNQNILRVEYIYINNDITDPISVVHFGFKQILKNEILWALSTEIILEHIRKYVTAKLQEKTNQW